LALLLSAGFILTQRSMIVNNFFRLFSFLFPGLFSVLSLVSHARLLYNRITNNSEERKNFQ
jgi:hypothetical protein